MRHSPVNFSVKLAIIRPLISPTSRGPPSTGLLCWELLFLLVERFWVRVPFYLPSVPFLSPWLSAILLFTLDQAHRRVTGLRNNAHHHVSITLVSKYHTLGIETLNVAGMIKAGLQSKALSDAGMSSLLEQIRYKADWYDTKLIEADQWYPSSKTCYACEVINRDLGREPEWACPNCNAQHDRNRNAARNLLKLALLAVGENVTLLDGAALASGDSTAGETAPVDGRTKPMTMAHSRP